MKNYKYYLIIIVLIMTIPIIHKATLKERKVNYKRSNYSISEHFFLKNNKHYYDYIIKNNDEEYSYTLEINNHKKKKLIKTIKTYKENNITCIVPIYKSNIKKEIYCLEDGKQVSKYYLKDNSDFNTILSKIKNFSIEKPESSLSHIDYKNISIYQNNIPDNYKIIIWTYKGIVIISNKKPIYQKFLDEDLYDNIMATTTKSYYVLFDNTKVNGIEKVYYYDLKKNRYNVFNLPNRINKNSYINGVIDDIIYITDRKKKKQYILNVKKKSIEEIGNEDLLYTKYENGIKKIISKTEFFESDQFFKEDITSSKTTKKEDNYYYYIEDNYFFKNRVDSKTEKLFFMSKPTEWNIFNGELLILKEDEIYLYNSNSGLKRIIKYNELKYNYKNIYYLWK